MWNKLSQAAALVTGETEEEKEDVKDLNTEDKEKLQHQELLVQQLKELVRENEKRFQEKTKECEEISSKFDKFKLQSKAKITHLSKQLKVQDKAPKKDDCDFDDASSTDSSDRSHKGKLLLYKKQLEQAKQQLERKEEESKTAIAACEIKINDLELQLNEKNILISSFAELKDTSQEQSPNSSPKKESNIQEMYAQIVYKDSKIMDLNNQILELEKKIMDLQENIKEKDEVLQQRNRAVQLMAEDLNRKGQTTVIKLDETRDQMKIMQQNFTDIESDWKIQLEKYQQRITELEEEIKKWDLKLRNNETITKNLESARYELSVKNAELQQKIVHVQESASKQCEQFNKEIQGEIEVLKQSLVSEKERCAELQKSLDESNNESKSKVFKARVEERTKVKKLERELKDLKKGNKDKPDEVLNLQQKVVELEEEKGTLQLKLIEIEDQIIQMEKLKEDNISMLKTIEEVSNTNCLLEKQISEEYSENQNLKFKFDTLQIDFDNLKEKFDILSKEHFESQEAMSILLETKKETEDNYSELNKKYNQLEIEFNEMVESVQKIKDEKVTFELKNIELEEMRDKDDKEKNLLRIKIEELQDLLNSEGRPLIQLERENSELKYNFEILEKNKSELENKNKELFLEIKFLKEKSYKVADKYNGEIERLNQNITKLENNNTALQQDLNTNEIEFKNLEKKAVNFENNISFILNLFNVKDLNEVTDVKSVFEATTKTNDSLVTTLKEKDNSIKNYISKIDSLQSCLDNQNKELLSCQSMISELNSNILEKNGINEDLKCDLENKLANAKLLNDTLREKEEQIATYSEEQKVLHQKLENMQNSFGIENEKAGEKIKIFLDQISDLENELTSLRKAMNSKNKIVEELNAEICKLSDENKNLLEKYEKNNTTLQEKDINVQDLKLTIENKSSEMINLNAKMVELVDSIKTKEADMGKMKKKFLEKIETKDKYIKEIDEATAELHRENHNLNIYLEEKTRNLDILNSKNLEMETALHNQEKEKNGLMLNLSNVEYEFNNLKLSSENLLSQLNEKENLYQNVIEEKFVMQKKISELNNTVDKLQEDINDLTTSIEKYQIECEKLSKEVCSLNDDLLKSNNIKLELDNLILNHQKEIGNLTDENKLLKNEIISMQEYHTLEISKLQEEMTTRIKKNVDEINIIKEEKSKLTELTVSLQTTLKKISDQMENQQLETNALQEEKAVLEKEIINYKGEIKSFESNYKAIEDELTMCKLEFSGERTEMEVLLQNSISELKDNVNKLKMEVKQHVEKVISLEKSNSSLENMIVENEQIITQQKFQLQSLETNILNLQNALTEQKADNTTKLSLENKLLYLEQCKQHYCQILTSLNTSFQANVDISFLECEQLEDITIEKFTQLSKQTCDYSKMCLSKNKDNINSLQNDLNILKEENIALSDSYISLKECISNLVSIMNQYTFDNESKFDAIITSLKVKEDSITHTNSKIGLFKSKLEASNNLIVKLVQILNESAEKVKEQLKITCNTLCISDSKLNDSIEKLCMFEKIATPAVFCDENSLISATNFCHIIITHCIETIQELNESLLGKNELITKMVEEKEECKHAFAKLESELLNSHLAEVTMLNNEIKCLHNQLEQFSLQSTSLENTNAKNKELQIDLNNYHQKLEILEEENISLKKQHADSNGVIQQTLDEKIKLESSLEEIKLQLSTSCEKNSALQFCLKDKESLIIDMENRIGNYENECSSYSTLLQNASEKLDGLQKESTKKDGIISKAAFVEKEYNNLKLALNKIKCLMSEKEKNLDLLSITSDLEDNDIIDLITEFYSNFLNLNKIHIGENKYLVDQIKKLESENKKITEELDAISKSNTTVKTSEMIEDSKQGKDLISVIPMDSKPKLDLIPLEASSAISNQAVRSLEDSNKSLKEELTEYKKKFAKMLSKLKIFKDEKEKLNKELKDIELKISNYEDMNVKRVEQITFLQEKIESQEREKETCMTKLQTVCEQNKQETKRLNSTISEMKERYSNLEEDFFKIQHEAQEYKETYKQINVSYELLKEDNERLRAKLKNLIDQSENSKSEISYLDLQMAEVKRENLHLKKEAENLREHSDMLLSDNDTYQNCIEKLTFAKNSLEKKLIEMKEKFDTNFKLMEVHHETELKNLNSEQSKMLESLENDEKIKNECVALKTLCTDLQLRVETLQLECDTYQKNQNLLEKEKTYFQHQLSEKTVELQKVKASLSEATSKTIIDISSQANNQSYSNISDNLSEISIEKFSELKDESAVIKQQMNTITGELKFAIEMNTFLQQELLSKETSYNERISQLENQLQHLQSFSNQPVDVTYQSNSMQLENELQQAMSSLHNQGLRCEELSLEVSKLLEERNILKWKLQQYIQLNPGFTIEQSSFNSPLPSLDLVSEKVELPFNDMQIATLHERLIETERTCQELRKANEALDRALINERDQKRIIEEELDLAKEHITEETRPSDEYHILLGDINDPEMLRETNFLISRKAKMSSHKFLRWLTGRRNYLCRTVKSRNYPQLVYLLYIFFIHIWLLSCTFS